MVNRNVVVVKEDVKYKVLFIYSSIILFSSLLFNTPSEIFEGMKRIVVSPSILLTGYISVGNLGSAFFNSGLLLLIALFMCKINKVSISGPIIASVLIIGGFAFLVKTSTTYGALLLEYIYIH